MQQENKLLTVGQVADWLSISKSSVYQMVEAGTLPVIRLGSAKGSIRFEQGDILEFLANSKTLPSSVQSPRTRARKALKHVQIK
ncbi:MAG: helix-turn-helix domain-containing protein [Aureliella sp.]